MRFHEENRNNWSRIFPTLGGPNTGSGSRSRIFPTLGGPNTGSGSLEPNFLTLGGPDTGAGSYVLEGGLTNESSPVMQSSTIQG